MKILNIQVLRGPNYWSNYRKKLIVLTLDLEQYEEQPTNHLEHFNDSLTTLIPTLEEHHCSIGVKGGFLSRLIEGTWLGHVIEHVALELQTLAGMECGFGRTYSTSRHGVYEVIFSYEMEQAGIYAGETAFRIVQSLASKAPYPHLEDDLHMLRRIFKQEQLGPSTYALVQEAEKRAIPYSVVPNSSLVILGQGCNQKKMWATVSSQTSSIAVEIASDKELTKKILDASFLPVPKGKTVTSLEELDKALISLSFPVVIKPLNGNHGRGVLTHIYTQEKAILGFEFAKKISNRVLVEEFIPGEDYRFLVVNYKVVAVAKRTPALIRGTGKHSIQQLIDLVNGDPQRGLGHENVLTTIKIDNETLSILMEKNLSLESILPIDELVYLKGTANLSAGGTATDVTEQVHKNNIRMAEKTARLINLDICGIDVVAEDITMPIQKHNGAIIEVNAGPGLRMHLQPTKGKARNVASPIIDMLYPANSTATIPVIAITGTNGKTTVARLMAYLAKKAQYHVGLTTTEGIYNNDQLIYAGDCSGPLSATAVLSDPAVNFAVLECARGGILRAGLAFNECDISIITNITSDHLGLKEIHSLEDLAQVKAVVARSTKKTGYAILNAEDDLVYNIKYDLSCAIALFAMDENERIKEHCAANGLACYLENDFIVVQKGQDKNYIAQISDIPLTFKNILPAVLAGIISNLSLTLIESALYDFVPTAENLPGRMNVFNFDHFQIMVDYAHNEGAYIELQNYLAKFKKRRKIGIIGVAGDRRTQDMQKIGYYAAELFDEIIIKHDLNNRGNANENITKALIEGIALSSSKPKIDVISDEYIALKQAINQATPETFIFYSPEKVLQAIEFVKNQQELNKFKLLIDESTLL
jgi:cyanophycin synthetase